MAAARAKPRISVLLAGAATFGTACAIAAMMPSFILFGLVLCIVGAAAQTLTTSTNSLVQISTAPEMRGRVIAILMAIALAGHRSARPSSAGWPIILGPRWAMGVGAASGLLAAITALIYLVRNERTDG